MSDDNTTLEILIKIREELDGLRRATEEIGRAKAQAAVFGGALDKNTVSTQNLNRASMLFAGVLSGNVATAAGAVRGAFVSMMGPLGLALGMAATLGAKLYSDWSKAGDAIEKTALQAHRFAESLKAVADAYSVSARAAIDGFAEGVAGAGKTLDNQARLLRIHLDLQKQLITAQAAAAKARLSARPGGATAAELAAIDNAARARIDALQNRGARVALDTETEKLKTLSAAYDKLADSAVEAGLKAAAAKREYEAALAAKDSLPGLDAQLRTNLAAQFGADAAVAESNTADNRTLAADLREARKELVAQRDAAQALAAQEETLRTAYESAAAALKDQNAASGDAAKKLRDQRTEVEQLARELGELNTAQGQIRDAETEAEQAAAAQAAAKVARAQAALALDRQLNDSARARATIEANRYLTEEQKKERLIPLLKEENRLIAARIALLAGDASPEASGEIRTLGNRAAGNTSALAQAAPASFGDEMAAGAVRAADQLGTSAQMAADAWGSAADSIRTGMGDALGDMIIQWDFSAQSINNAIWSIEQAMIRSAANMVADWIFQHTVMAAWSALFRTTEVVETEVAAAEKTAIEAAAAAESVGVKTATEAAKTGIHVAAEATQTTTTVTGAATRSTANAGEGMSWLVKAAIQAMNAMASIPYVGPVLAVVAAGAVLAAGMALLGKIVKRAGGGRVYGRNTLTMLNDGGDGDEFVIRGASRAKYGDSMLAEINAGTYDPALLTASLAELPFAAAPDAQLAAVAAPPVSSGGGAAALAAALGAAQPAPNITQRFFMDWAAARSDILTSGDFRDAVRDITRDFFRTNA
jgi:hypothetical protein